MTAQSNSGGGKTELTGDKIELSNTIIGDIVYKRHKELTGFIDENKRSSARFLIFAIITICAIIIAITGIIVLHSSAGCSAHHDRVHFVQYDKCMKNECPPMAQSPCESHTDTAKCSMAASGGLHACCDKSALGDKGSTKGTCPVTSKNCCLGHSDSNKCTSEVTCMEDHSCAMHCMPCPPCHGENEGCRIPVLVYIIAAFLILLIIAVIVALAQSGKRSKSADNYRDELIILRDLIIAVELAEKMGKSSTKIVTKTDFVNGGETAKTITTTEEPAQANAMAEIIETLLNKCNS